jgi:O-antigen/teichoic acid export membrane protein
MLHRMSEQLSGAGQAASAEKVVHSSATSLALGMGLLLGGGVVAFVGQAVHPLLMILGLVVLIFGAVQFAVGVYQFADNVDRAAKALITGRHD